MYQIVVLGGGESGVGAALLAKKLGLEVFLSDGGTIRNNYRATLEEANIPFEEGKHTEKVILNAHEVIKSPGIAEKTAIMQAIRKAGITVISEIAFAARHTNAKLIAITGTNGKTTTTSLIFDVLHRAGLKVGLAGNIGDSFAKQVAFQNYTHYVLEVSSFQLDDIADTRFDIAILTNITPDHLDRYNYQMLLYMEAKMKITNRMKAEQIFIYNADDPITQEAIERFGPLKATCIAISQTKILTQGAWQDGNEINIKVNNQHMKINNEELSLQGKHNRYNSMAAGVVGMVENIRKETIRESLMMFDSLEHRLEKIATVGGVEYINDSKATNVNAAWYALESMQGPLIWIAGGVDKGNDYNLLKPLIRSRVKAIVCLGVDNRRIHEAFNEDTPLIVNTDSMEACVKMCHQLASKGDKVLLSPACASFDLFSNYEDRGQQFRYWVKQL